MSHVDKIKDDEILIIGIDFDGVLHQYDHWEGPDVLYSPIPGAIAWLRGLINNRSFKVYLYSSRLRYDNGFLAVFNWLLEHGVTQSEMSEIEFVREKPPFFLLIDDRAFQFQGKFPGAEEIKSFNPWQCGENEDKTEDSPKKKCPFKPSSDFRPLCDREQCMIYRHGECALSRVDDLITLLVRRT